jgi:hypothetical protein
MRAEFSETEEFVGYTFQGFPERRPRLWFLDRHIRLLLLHGLARQPVFMDFSAVIDIDTGDWRAHLPDPRLDEDGQRALAGITLRYEHGGADNWTAVWRLTKLHIPHVHNFGRDDDTWRLGLWPD